VDELVAGGLSRARAMSRLSFEAAVAQGYLAYATGAVETLTGRPPTSVRDFLASEGLGVAVPPTGSTA
jgi:hypothetical protein